MFSFATDTSTFIKEQIALPGRFALKNNINYSEPHSQNRLYEASFLLMRLLRHVKLLICLNASIRRTQFCMALNSYQLFYIYM